MRTRSRPLLAWAVVPLVITALIATGCAADRGGDPKELRLVLTAHVYTDALLKRIPEFERRTGIRVSTTVLQADQASNTYSVRLNAGSDDIDVMMYRPLQEHLLFSGNGWLDTMPAQLRTDPDWDWSDFQPATRARTTDKGRVRGVPVVTERPVLYYRKDLLAKAGIPVPRTMDDLLAAARELHDPRHRRYGFVGRGQRSQAVTQFSSFLYSYGGNFLRDGRSEVATPEAVAAYRTYGKLLGDYGPPGVTNMSLEQAMPIFAQGRAAFYVDADAIYTNFVDPKISVVGDRTGYAQLPAGPAGSKPYNVPSWGLAVSEFSGRKDPAWRFVRWATNKATVAAIQADGVPGARQSAWDDPATLREFPQDLARSMKDSTKVGVGYDRPPVVQVGRARDTVGTPIVTALLGGDVEADARTADDEFTAFLERDQRHRDRQ